MEYITIFNSKLAKESIRTATTNMQCEICKGIRDVRHLIIEGKGHYICDKCRTIISALTHELNSQKGAE